MEKRGVTFFKGVAILQKNKMKSEIFDDKKSLQTKIFFSVISKTSNLELSTKNLGPFKR